jgi:transposase InsO family protein
VLSDADLLSRWKRSAALSGEYHFRPTGPHQQWHTDVIYRWVSARFYFLVNFVDAYSRRVVHHKLLIELKGQSAAIECTGDAKPRIVHDQGRFSGLAQR